MRALTAMWIALLISCGKPASQPPPQYPALPRAALQGQGTRLPADTHPLHYHVVLELVPERPTYRGEVAIDVALDRPRDTLWLHHKGMRADSVRVVRPGAEPIVGQLESTTPSGLGAVRLAQAVGPGLVRLEIRFEADVGERLYGIYRARAGGEPYLFSQFEPISAREAFPCFDEPRFKTPFDVTLRVKQEHIAITNTRELSSKPLPDGMREVRFATTEKLPTYLVAFAVGPFDVVDAPAIAASEVRPSPLPLRGIAPRGRGAELAHALRETPLLLEKLEAYFAIAYPFDKLDLIAVPDFAAGAMENAGAITFRDSLLLVAPDATENQRRQLAYVNAHELAHQWFGNLVTMPWWDDIWLNESFATWMGARAVEEVHPHYGSRLSALAATHHAMEVDSQAGTRAIHKEITRDEDIPSAFDAITYAKGGAVLGMFERYLGAEVFRDGLRLYMQRHRFGSATADDLLRALSDASGKPELREAFSSFLGQPGVPLVEARLSCTAGAPPTLQLHQSRYARIGSQAEREVLWQIPVCVRYASPAPQEQCLLLRERELSVPLASASCPAWLMPNAGANGYYRWTQPSGDLDALLAASPSLSSAEQVSLASNLFAGLRGGALPAAAALDALAELVKREERLVLEAVLAAFQSVEHALLDDASVPLYRARLRELLAPRYRELGLFPAAGEADAERALTRAVVVRSLALHARDPELLGLLSSLGRAELGVGSDPRLGALPPELRDEALTVALRGDTTLLEPIIARLAQAEDGQLRSRLLAALSALDDPAHTERVLALSLDERLRVNERLSPLFGQLSQRATRERAYAWLKANFDVLVTRLGGRARSDLMRSSAYLCDTQKLNDARGFFGERAALVAGGEHELALALEAAELCIAFAEREAAGARAWFAERSAPRTRAAAPR